MSGISLRTAWSEVRYRFNHGGGAWAAAHQLADNSPLGRYVDSRLVSEQPSLVVAYRGFAAGARYVVPFLREQVERVGSPIALVERHGRPATVNAPAPDPDIMFTGCGSPQAEALPADHSLVLPFRIQQVLEVLPDMDAMSKRVSRNERKQFANLRSKSDWAWERGRTMADLVFFYERMHLPTMGYRHGEAARSADWDTAVNCLFQRGALFFVTEGGKRVAGVLCRFDDDRRVLRTRLLGVLDGDEQHYRSGAAKALWYLGMECSVKHDKIKEMDMSGGEPFPGKGVFQFKRRLHPMTSLPTDHFRNKRLHVRVLRDTDAVRDFLVLTPMIAIDGAGNLSSVHFSDSTRPAQSRIIGTGPGIETACEIDLDEFLAGLDRTTTAAPELRQAEAA